MSCMWVASLDVKNYILYSCPKLTKVKFFPLLLLGFQGDYKIHLRGPGPNGDLLASKLLRTTQFLEMVGVYFFLNRGCKKKPAYAVLAHLFGYICLLTMQNAFSRARLVCA